MKLEVIQEGGSRRVTWGTRITMWSSWGAILVGYCREREKVWSRSFEVHHMAASDFSSVQAFTYRTAVYPRRNNCSKATRKRTRKAYLLRAVHFFICEVRKSESG